MQLEKWLLTRFVHYIRNPRKNDHAAPMAAVVSFISSRSVGESTQTSTGATEQNWRELCRT